MDKQIKKIEETTKKTGKELKPIEKEDEKLDEVCDVEANEKDEENDEEKDEKKVMTDEERHTLFIEDSKRCFTHLKKVIKAWDTWRQKKAKECNITYDEYMDILDEVLSEYQEQQ